ncbi:MAG: hypothetical protein ACRDT8_06255 [Micromonosporaceae bacterium]
MRREAAILGVAMMLLAGVSGCGGGSDPGSAGRDDKPMTAQPTESEATPSESPSAEAPTVRVKIKSGKVTAGGGVHKIKLNSTVTLEITSDVADEAHVHGYDKTIKLKPGKPTRTTFTADIPGGFEVELHHAGTVLCELQVQ